MELSTSLTRLEAALTAQLALLGGEAALGGAAGSLYAALEPAFRQLGLDLAEQAAAEVGAQLPEREVDVVLVDGEPGIRIRSGTEDAPPATDELDARLTLRLPEALKRSVEEAAEAAGDSVNTWIVKTLAARTRRPDPSVRSAAGRGEFET